MRKQIPSKCIHDENHGKYLIWEFKVFGNKFVILNTHPVVCSGGRQQKGYATRNNVMQGNHCHHSADGGGVWAPTIQSSWGHGI